MSRFLANFAVSLDGYLAASDGSVDFLEGFPPPEPAFSRFLDGIETIVMGRASYEQALGFGLWPYAGKRCVVVTRAPLAIGAPEGVVPWHEGPARLADALAREVGRGDVWVCGGARLFDAFLDIGRIDSIELSIVPVVLGGGIPLFRAGFERRFALRSAEAAKGGLARLVYEMG